MRITPQSMTLTLRHMRRAGHIFMGESAGSRHPRSAALCKGLATRNGISRGPFSGAQGPAAHSPPPSTLAPPPPAYHDMRTGPAKGGGGAVWWPILRGVLAPRTWGLVETEATPSPLQRHATKHGPAALDVPCP